MSDERDPNLLTPNEFEAQDGVEDWRITCDGVTATFRTASFASGTQFAGRIASSTASSRGCPTWTSATTR